MPIELWGATGTVGLAWPERLVGTLLLVLYGAFLLFVLYYYRDDLRQMTLRRWLAVAGLSLAGLGVSQFLPIFLSFGNQREPLVLFAAAPFLLAGASIHPAAALIVGMFTGLGRALGQSHLPFDIFNFALAAVLAAIWMQQPYRGRFYQWLRQPVIAGSLNMVGLVFWIGVAGFAGAKADVSGLTALDMALSTAGANFWPLLVEGMVGGGVVMLVFMGLPHLKPQKKLEPSPMQLSLRHRLLGNFVVFAVTLTVLLTAVVFYLSIYVSTRLVVNQMAHNAQTVSAAIPEFQTQLQNALLQYEQDAPLLAEDGVENEKALAQMFRANPIYRRIVLVNDEGVVAFYPRDVAELQLTQGEETAVSRVFSTNTPGMSPAQANADDYIFSFMVPVHDERGKVTAVLVGRVPQLSLDNLIVGLQGTVGQGSGFIVDEHDQIIAHFDSDRLGETWTPPETARPIRMGVNDEGIAYQGHQRQTNARELVYYVKSKAHSWTTVVTVPHEVVLNLALSIGAPLTLVVMAVMGIVYGSLAAVGRNVTNPLTELVQASKKIAAGEKWEPSALAKRDDEIGQLNQAFYQMYQSRNKRLNELSLLLGVSHEVSANMDVKRGVAAILRGALRGTGATGARAVVLNPSGSYPLQYGEGPSAKKMGVWDRQLMTQLRHTDGLVLSSPAEIRKALGLAETAVLPVSSFIAIPLHSHDRFLGILWMGYPHPHTFDQTERDLLQTLAGQAAVLVENARLFATAEGGRRRLAAVLASTSDAVIVTDQTNRILLVNRAMEKLFDLKSNQVIGRPVTDVVKAPELAAALANGGERTHNLEIAAKNDRIYYANVSSIYNNEGQAIGRVAVLHDITHLKEIDEMKSEFVRTVSHDLRNPLTFMRGYTTMLPMVGDINEDQRKYLDKIQGGIEQMQRLIDDLLDLSRIEAGIDVTSETIAVPPLLADIADEHWQHAHLKGLTIDVEAADNLPPVTCDQLLIRQAITNLLTNGIKYAPDSGFLKLKAEAVNGEMVFSVTDNGPGIPKEHQMRLFEKFYRAKQRGEERVKGIGLGLAIVKSIAERHGGRAWVRSEQGRGSTFYISLPLQNGSH